MWKKAAQQLIQGKPAGKVWNELARKDPLAAKAATRINQVVYDAEKLVDNVWHGKPTKTASVPFMMTRDMKSRLSEAGFSEQMISSMLPAQAHHVLENKLTVSDFETWDSEQQKQAAAASAADDAAVAAAASTADSTSPHDTEVAALASVEGPRGEEGNENVGQDPCEAPLPSAVAVVEAEDDGRGDDAGADLDGDRAVGSVR